MVYFGICLMVPVGLLFSSILNHFLEIGTGQRSLQTTSAGFKMRISLYMYAKAGISLLCCGLCFLISEPPSGTESGRKDQESKAYGLCSQLKILLSNGAYLTFVFGPMFSICLMTATNDNLKVLLTPFKILPVSS